MIAAPSYLNGGAMLTTNCLEPLLWTGCAYFAMLAERAGYKSLYLSGAGVDVTAVTNLAVWGNHSPTMYADYRFATVDGKSVKDMVHDDAWNRDVFLPTVGKRGAAIIAARGVSSAASAANAAIDHVRDWMNGSGGKWVTMGVPSDGSYGIPADVMYGVPVTTALRSFCNTTESRDPGSIASARPRAAARTPARRSACPGSRGRTGS